MKQPGANRSTPGSPGAFTPHLSSPQPSALKSQLSPAPRDFLGTLRQLGPGLIISAVIVGSGELIVTPKLGAEEGFKLLWFIILGCVLKVFVQIELGRYAITRGRTTLEALNTLPGPRILVSWVLWIWLAMYLCLVPQVAGMVGGAATALKLGGVTISISVLAILIAGSCAILLIMGRYQLVEKSSIIMVGIFTVTTMVAVGALQFTEFAVTGSQLASGFTFQMPASLITAFGAFGIIGVGASELIYYPYWCLEKGYAARVGLDDGTPEWREAARGWLRVMRIDAWVSFVIYTLATIAFYLLGAAILHARNMKVESGQMIETLSHMYRSAFGEWSLWLFLVGAIVVLYSTIFGATASNARLFADAVSLFGFKKYRDPEHRVRWVKIGCVVLPIAFTAVFLIFGNPVNLVFWGAVAQGMMLPFLAGAALYFHFTNRHRDLRASPLSLACLTVAALLMAALGIYQVTDAVSKEFQKRQAPKTQLALTPTSSLPSTDRSRYSLTMFSLQRLLGKEDKFFDLLEASAQESRTSVQALIRFMKNPDELKTLDEFVMSRRKEKKINDEISEALCTTFVTALEREDIEALSIALYKIPKTMEKIGERILLAPHLFKGIDLTRQISMLEKATDTLCTMLGELRRGVHLEKIRSHNDQLQVLEGEGDKLILEELKRLYTGSNDGIKVVFLKDIFELIEKVFDRCRDAGNVINHIVLKNS